MAEIDELPIALPSPPVKPEAIAQLVDVLRTSGTWMKAEQIAEAMGGRTTDRRVRKIASAAGPAVVSYPGSPGYKLWELCTVEEISHCIASFESQGADMYKRAVHYRQAYHRRFRGAPSP